MAAGARTCPATAAYNRAVWQKAAGIPDGPHAYPNGLRHGFGVQAVSRGIALNMVQKCAAIQKSATGR